MKTNFPLIWTVMLFFVSGLALARQADNANTGSWSGVIINSNCSPDEAFAEAAKCTDKGAPGAKLSLYDDTTRQIFILDPQDQAVGHLGDSVTVSGTVEGNTLHVASFKTLTDIGLAVGRKAPTFLARDQSGQEQSLDRLKGPNGTVLLFFRSADWWPYCKGQLVELQNAKARFEKQGIKLAAISYDSEEILKYFAGRRKIEFPLLADPDSKVIRAYEVLNVEATGQFKGMARPGYFFIDTKGVIREKFFEAKYRERFSGNNVIGKLFPALGDEVTDNVEAPHLSLAVEQSDLTGFPGGRITLTAEVQLPPDVHVYAPGVQGYKPIALVMDRTPGMEYTPVNYPRAKVLYLPAIKERVPVFEGKFRITQDLKVSSAAEFSNSLGTDGKTFAITGKLDYQACDTKICFLPTSVPVRWQLQVLPLDRQRAPEAIRHK
jgi:peroxiredoxin